MREGKSTAEAARVCVERGMDGSVTSPVLLSDLFFAAGGTNALHLTGIAATPTSVVLGVCWPDDLFLTSPTLDFHVCTNLASNVWHTVAQTTAPAGRTNLAVAIASGALPGGAVPPMLVAAVTASDAVDLDNDHLADTNEVASVDYDHPQVAWSAGLTDVFDRAEGVDSGSAVIPLPFPVCFGGICSTTLVACVDGIVAFPPVWNPRPTFNPGGANADLATCRFGSGCGTVIAAYWDDLSFAAGRTAVEGVLTGVTPDPVGSRRFILQYRNPDPVAGAAATPHPFVVTLILFEDEPTVAYVLYQLARGHNCSSATIGAVGPDGIPCLSVSHDTLWGVANYTSVTYRFGTGTDPATADTDGDGLRDDAEFVCGANPRAFDSDGDGLPDAWEVAQGLDPCGPGDASLDSDGDGLSNLDEYLNNSDPRAADSDADGTDDAVEVAQGSDPRSASDGGCAPPDNACRTLTFTVGGDYAAWEMTVEGLGPTDMRVRRICMRAPDEPQTNALKLCKGNDYRLSARWRNCQGHEDAQSPWFCWQAQIDSLPTARTFNDYSAERLTGNELVVGDGWIAENADGLLSAHVHECTKDVSGGTGAGNVAGTLTATLHALADPVVEAPRVIGVNNDDDDGNGTEDWLDHFEIVGEDDLAEVRVSAHLPSGVAGTVRVTPYINILTASLWRDRTKQNRAGSPDVFAVPEDGNAERIYALEGCNFSSESGCERILVQVYCRDRLVLEKDHRFTVVDMIAEPITTERVNGQIVNPSLAVLGEETRMKIDVRPGDFTNSLIRWTALQGSVAFKGGNDTGREVVFTAQGATNEPICLEIACDDCPGRRPRFTLSTCTLQEVKIYPCEIRKEDDESEPMTNARLRSLLEGVNQIYRQAGLHFSLGATIATVTNDDWAVNGLVSGLAGWQIRNLQQNRDGLEIYFLEGVNKENNRFLNQPNGAHTLNGIIVRSNVGVSTIAHEIGHACALADIYADSDVLGNSDPRMEWVPSDWSNGTGSRFYDTGSFLTQRKLIRRLLMYGKADENKADLPLGGIYGQAKDGILGLLNVGVTNLFLRRPVSH